MDEREMQVRIGRALFPGDPDRLTLRIRRGFPGSRPGHALVEYEVTVREGDDGSSVAGTLHARLGAGGRKRFGRRFEVLTPPLDREGRTLLLEGKAALALDDPEMVLSAFPLDDRLPWLPDLLDPEVVAKILDEDVARLCGEAGTFRVCEPEVVGYRAGKRCTIRYRVELLDPDGGHVRTIPVVGKTHHDDRGRVVFKNLEQLWNWPFEEQGARPSITPRPVAYVPEYNAYFQELQSGLSLYEARVGELRRGFIRRAGGLLASLHTTGIVVDGTWGPADELALIRRWLGHLGIVRADLREAAGGLLARIEAAADRDGIHAFAPVISHRDFYDKQVISGADTLRFIDLDTMTMADPAIDVGNFLAHVFLRAIQRDRPRDEIDREAETFLAAYRGVQPALEEERVVFYTATSLFRLACLYAYRPKWRGLSATLLEACRSRLTPARASGHAPDGGWGGDA
jgi:hypothetical protein